MTKAELYKKACMLPLLPGVYIIRDKSGTIIYIGKAKRLRIRVSQYFREGVPHDNKVSQMIAHAYAFDVIVCQSEFEALVLEASQIKAHTPKYNILLKDDKGYSYIKVTKDEWPRLSFTLQKEDDGAEYIGPYTSSFAARQMAETAMDAFLLPRCSRRFPQEIGRGRPCLNAHIGKCMAVCSGKISRENYEQAVKSAVHLIRYGKKDILKTLNERMLEASDRLEFETAALIRDQIAAITKVTAGQKVVVDPDVEMDVVALAGTPGSVCAAVLRFREGRLTDKREFLFHDTADIAAVREEFLPRYYLDDEQIPKVIAVDELPPDVDALQQALNEKRGSEVQLYVPQRGDKAHLVEMAHTNAVERLARESGRYAREEKLLDELAQVLGLPKPPRTIESYDISNWGDGTSVCGMVTFREMAANGEPSSNYFGQKPDLLLMDGGRGQVSAAKAALAGTALADVPLYGMVKDDHHRTRAIVDSEGREIAINMNRGTFTFVTAIQDETHRFANAYRKQQMKQKSYSSTLTEVPGVGPKTAKALMTQFKSVGAVKEATPDQLENTPGVGRQMAQTIYEYFHPQG
jgi:excinuclease ABC subunit C